MTPGRIWAACLALLTAPLAWRLLQEPSAFWWLVAVAAFLVTVGSLTAAKRRSAENIDLRAEGVDKDDHIAALEAECTRLHLLLTEAQIGDTVPVPLLRIVPSQRDGEHDRLAMSRDEWDAIERETRKL